MDNSFINNLQSKNMVAITKQVRAELANKVLETLATRKVELAKDMGLDRSK